ncbi:MAG: RagB/SusD family nutrient uptake outer membrane protein [Bacteroidales bacterium]|nr:RagB/SusD family nutrient uptake outer membrane protein [Bacteroidales bacterium]
MKRLKTNILKWALVLPLVFTACMDDLNTIPLDTERVTSESVYANEASYKQALAKLYGGLMLTGQQGPAGDADIISDDEGFSSYLRVYWNAQELPTDEVLIRWTDNGLAGLNQMNWTATNSFIFMVYTRIFYQITMINEYLRQTTDEKLDSREVSAELRTEIGYYRAEARFLRALSYWHALDLFGGNVPFVTEEDELGSFKPEATNPQALFEYLEAELKAIETELMEPLQNEYARVDRVAAWMLLAKLYLNADVYYGEERYTECLDYCKLIINSGYVLEPVFQNLFLADNDQADGIIFTLASDGISSQTYGGTTYLVNAAVFADYQLNYRADYGTSEGWAGLRTTSAFVDFFRDSEGELDTLDSRNMLFTEGRTLDITDMEEISEGYLLVKYKNIDRDGVEGSNVGSRTYVDTDFPMFRLADAYLMYAEALLRGGTGGDMNTATDYVNSLLERAYGNSSQNISPAGLDLDLILRERTREFAWEGHRRTDLRRFGLFTGDQFLWPFKGGALEGTGTPAKFEIFPIPTSDINANPNLEQNPGY